ncbi:MAG: gamma-glutamylcyclotransferase [Candidatus Eisenbacteria bacterium]|uniref:Gamma-glutamylcyclotransferase n=1 Tax=Eiseniibacteriota bacterium TaxID=2212470 RepID=A0A933SH02_UNCEI|nr:gamma-glutamylcyclotransferase [Candidatus Eisenbacteria bacterium]
MHYFAYGSNLCREQMEQRCPSAMFVGIAQLPGHRLAFNRYSKSRGCGVADVVEAEREEVWGVVYELSDLDLQELDRAEGFRLGRSSNSYWRRDCVVLLDGESHRPCGVQTYFAEPQPSPPPPSREYKALIVDGARAWNLPEQYIARLEAIEVGG